MIQCKYYDCGWCYAPDDVETSASSQSACFDYDFCPYLKSQMTELEEKIQRVVNKVMESKKTELEPQQIIKDGDYIYFRGEKYQKVESPKPKTLYDVIDEWWSDVFCANSEDDMENCIETLVERIAQWLPKEQSAAGSQNVYVECSVEGYNDCLNEIKSKLR